jgi:hypothetical protein
MRLWNALESNLFSNEIFMLSLFVSGIVPKIWLGDTISLFHFIAIATYVYGTNLMKLRKSFGFFVVTISALTFLIPTNDLFITHILCIAAVAYFLIMVFPKLLMWRLNFPVLKALSKEKGFPSFAEKKDTGCIVEESAPLEKKEKKKPIIMDVGYDEPQMYKKAQQTQGADSGYKPKKDEAWNAFNYLDNDTQNTAYDDFSYMEQMQEHKLKQKPLDEKLKPNKNMGRNFNNED